MAQLAAPVPFGRSIRLLSAGLVAAMVVFLGAGIVVANHVATSIDELVVGTGTARLQAGAAQAVLSALQEAETGQRGYLLTGKAEYLAPYDNTIGQIDGLVATLQRRAIGMPMLEEDTKELAAAARRKLDGLRHTIELAQREGLPAAREEVMADAGKAAMDDARSAAARIIDRAEAERARRASLLQHRQLVVTNLLLGGLCAGFLLLGAAALVLLWNYARLRQARLGEQRETARLAAAIEHVPEGVAVFDRAGLLTLANTRFGPALALPPTLAQPGTQLETIAAAALLDTPVLAGGRPAAPRTSEVTAGARTLDVWRSPMPDGGQMLAVADVSRRVAAEEVARQAQKMDVLGQMTGGVAHDFNNLLQVVSANLELVRGILVRGTATDPIILARLDAAAAGVGRGARLTRHLLAFARKQPLAPEPLDPGRLLIGMEEVLRRTLGDAITLNLVIADGLWSMRADPTQFENALLNLALNARDAMGGADGMATGRLTIEASNTVLDDAYAGRVPDLAPGHYVMFAIADTGCGMTSDQIGRAMEPFYTTKPEGSGTGLGLPMVLGFAKQSGGHFQLYSEPGQGTTARMYIPRTTAAVAPPVPLQSAPPTADGELVLLVEDDVAVRHAARDALTGLGYQVVEAESPDAALILLNAGCRPHILFTDVVMPGGLTAPNLARLAKTMLPGIAVLFTSGYTKDSIVHNGQLDADVTLISKPWRTDDLARALRSVLSGAPNRHRQQRRVLLVEDDEAIRTITAEALADLGFDVLEASTGASALQRLIPPPDLLMTDLGLPDQDGLSLAAAIRLRLPGLPVVVVSGHSEPPATNVIWLAKPYDLEGLKHTLAQALDPA